MTWFHGVEFSTWSTTISAAESFEFSRMFLCSNIDAQSVLAGDRATCVPAVGRDMGLKSEQTVDKDKH